MPTIAMYPGSFDPVTNGHLDIIKRSSRMFDKVIVAVLVNSAKTPLFTVEERVAMLRESCKNIPNVEIDSFNGLTVTFAKQKGATVMVRGGPHELCHDARDRDGVSGHGHQVELSFLHHRAGGRPLRAGCFPLCAPQR